MTDAVEDVSPELRRRMRAWGLALGAIALVIALASAWSLKKNGIQPQAHASRHTRVH